MKDQNERKICPLLSVGQHPAALCYREACAWWINPCPALEQSGCTLPILAEQLADPLAVNDLTGELSLLTAAVGEIDRHL